MTRPAPVSAGRFEYDLSTQPGIMEVRMRIEKQFSILHIAAGRGVGIAKEEMPTRVLASITANTAE